MVSEGRIRVSYDLSEVGASAARGAVHDNVDVPLEVPDGGVGQRLYCLVHH